MILLARIARLIMKNMLDDISIDSNIYVMQFLLAAN